jgi:hypothetical protein
MGLRHKATARERRTGASISTGFANRDKLSLDFFNVFRAKFSPALVARKVKE